MVLLSVVNLTVHAFPKNNIMITEKYHMNCIGALNKNKLRGSTAKQDEANRHGVDGQSLKPLGRFHACRSSALA
jgi:hypothetical protein